MTVSVKWPLFSSIDHHFKVKFRNVKYELSEIVQRSLCSTIGLHFKVTLKIIQINCQALCTKIKYLRNETDIHCGPWVCKKFLTNYTKCCQHGIFKPLMCFNTIILGSVCRLSWMYKVAKAAVKSVRFLSGAVWESKIL